ncbi:MULTISPECIES: hypothetical protein [Oceanobacillus]|uniref:Uncharacterized protein n=1 Tax=Oceanobacillus indicireducens TaxID=1004261 RepID=A0A917Y598_9BACI|nr:hypothetical protein [Oceanobacillus indicireducens]GGN65751.1 hypothetical protein GCM10007971_34980 [Oceanobacillus indicireducens]
MSLPDKIIKEIDMLNEKDRQKVLDKIKEKYMFQKAAHSVMIGSHLDFAPYATESILLEGNYERDIINKMKELVKAYNEVEMEY